MKRSIMAVILFSLVCMQTVFAGEIVKPQSIYESKNFSKTVNETILALEARYPERMNVFEIGKSVQGESILAVAVGKGNKQVLINGTHHARESLTTVLILDQIDYIAKLAEENKDAVGVNVRGLLDRITIVFVPLVNPDGANLVLNGKESISEAFKNKPYLKPGLFTSWKSNINGVDLNRNYPTKNPDGVSSKVPSSEGYKGPTFISEPETQALKKLCEERLFDGSISYHSSGEIIFWHFNQKEVARDQRIAQAVSKATGYSLVARRNPSKGNGFKDWFVETYEKPGLTIEISPYVGSQIVPFHRYQSIWEKNKDVAMLFGRQIDAEIARKIPYIPSVPIIPEEPVVPTEPIEPVVPEEPTIVIHGKPIEDQ